MAMDAVFRQLSVVLVKLHDAFEEFHVTIGDKPPNDETALADALGDAVLDMMGTIHEIRGHARAAQKYVAHPSDFASARNSLGLCQEQFQHLEQQFASEVLSYKALTGLARLAAERPAWGAWATTARQSIERCREPMDETRRLLVSCWQELAEKGAGTSISIRNAVVGQKIEAPQPDRDREYTDRMT